MSFQYPFWERYLNIFDKVIVVARVQEVNSVDESKHHRVDGDNVCIEPLPYYHGPIQFFKQKGHVSKSLFSIISKHKNAAIIMRVGSPLADILQNKLAKMKRPYGLEVVGDPWDVFRPGTFNNPLRPLMRLYFAYKLRKQCAQASALSYVTDQALQARYPGKAGCFNIGASSINLLEEHLLQEPRKFENISRFKFIYVGTLEQLQKAPDILIQAAAKLKERVDNFEIHFIGEGKCKQQLQTLGKELNIENHLIFHGMIPAGDPVRLLLDSSHTFILPSRGEGLPRAMIEAMARALPCIGSDIGGIKELLHAEDIVPVGSITALSEKMYEFISRPDSLQTKSERNLLKASHYQSKRLTEKRNTYYKHIREITESKNAC